MVIWLRMIIISQKQLAEVVSGIDIISFANKISYLQALGLSYIGGNFLKNEYFKIHWKRLWSKYAKANAGVHKGIVYK